MATLPDPGKDIRWKAIASDAAEESKLKAIAGWDPFVGLEGRFDPQRNIAREGVADLYRITATEKARAVPYVKIWQVARDSNQPIGKSAVSTFFREPAQFGKSLGNVRYGERPDVSLESVNVKVSNPTGFILFREITLSVVVHRPDALFTAGSERSRIISALVTPGSVFVLSYGWQGGSGAILATGHNLGETIYYTDPNDPREKLKRQDSTLMFPARQSIRFSVTHYTFTIRPDGQIQLNIHGYEDGELQVRTAVFLDVPGDTVEKRIESLMVRLNETAKQEQNQEGDSFITLKGLLDVLVLKPLVSSLHNLSYKSIDLNLGVMNGKLPVTNELYGGQDHHDQSLASFKFPLKEVKRIIDTIMPNQQITIMNVIRAFMSQLMTPDIYVNNAAGLSVSLPNVQLKATYDVERGKASIWIIDLKRYLTRMNGGKFDEHDFHKQKAEIRKKNIDQFLRSNSLPLVTLGRGDSFIQDARFEVVIDENMKSAYIARQLKLDRQEFAGGKIPDKLSQDAIDTQWLIYRSSIHGDITMLGNFVFDTFRAMWIDFGIPVWDGLFDVLEKTDRITASEFMTTIKVIAEGSNPVGTLAPLPTTLSDFSKDLERTKSKEAEAQKATQDAIAASQKTDTST